jgi:hypothetical protein
VDGFVRVRQSFDLAFCFHTLTPLKNGCHTDLRKVLFQQVDSYHNFMSVRARSLEYLCGSFFHAARSKMLQHAQGDTEKKRRAGER